MGKGNRIGISNGRVRVATCVLVLSVGVVMAAPYAKRISRQLVGNRDVPVGNDRMLRTNSSGTPKFVEPVSQSGGQYDLARNIIAGGGGASSGGNFTIAGTIGEVSASTTQSGGTFTMDGGFWNMVANSSSTSSPTPSPTPTLSPTPIPSPTPTSSPIPSPTPNPTPTPPANVVQFGASNYDVQEACTSVTITVNRSGDSSAAAAVDYRTSDVTATERRDYITAIGTLQFAPGETSKSFVVLINDDSYVEGNETFNITLSNPIGMTLGAPAVATVTIIDNPTEPATNVIDDPLTYVCQNYHDFLNRQPDQSGWDFWTNEILSCGSDQACIDVKRVNVSAAFFLSIEFQNTGYLVERLYKTAFGDAAGMSTFPSSHQLAVPIVRFRELLADTQEIGRGVVVGQGNWEQTLENNKQMFAVEFVQRSSFSTVFPASLTAVDFIDKLNSNANNPLSQAERDMLASQLANGVVTRAQVLRTIAEHTNLVNGEFNRAFVLMQFFGYLRRNPNDPQDTDYTGDDFWLTKLNQFNGDFVHAEMVKAFIQSSEYRQRFGP